MKEWGGWVRGGEPQLSSMWKAMNGRGAQDLRAMPPDIQEIDHVICIAEPKHRHALIKFYSESGTQLEKSASLNISRWQFLRRVSRAEWFVHSELDAPAQKNVQRAQNVSFCRNYPTKS